MRLVATCAAVGLCGMAGCSAASSGSDPFGDGDSGADDGASGLPGADAATVDAGVAESAASTDAPAAVDARSVDASKQTGIGAEAGSLLDAAGGANDGGGSTVPAIPLTTPDGTYYSAVVTAGGQSFALDIDTGSATTGIAGTGCTTCTSAGISPLYVPSASAVDTRRTAMTMYADGSSWSGEIYQDSVGLGYGTPNVTLELVSIHSQSQFFVQSTYEGILGLGPSQLEEPGTDSYVSQVIAGGLAPILAFELCAARGTMWLGGFDASAAASAMQYTPMLPIDAVNNPFYAIDIDDLAIGGTSLGFQASAFQSPIVDTGTSLFYFPTPIFNALVAAVSGSAGYRSLFGSASLTANTAGCVSSVGATAAMVDGALPAMTVSLPSDTSGSPDFVLTLRPTQSYLYDAGNGAFCLAAGDAGAMQGTTLGDAFLSAFVTVVDRQAGRVGFAPDVGCGNPVGHRVVDRATWHPRPPRHHR